MINIFDKFSFHCKSALKGAMSVARKTESEYVEPKHILYGILQEKGSLGYEILKQANISPDDVWHLVRIQENGAPWASHKTPSGLLSYDGKKILEKATAIASAHNHSYVGTEHLLSGIVWSESETLKNFFTLKNINVPALKDKIHMVLKSTSKFPDLAQAVDSMKGRENDFLPLTRKDARNKTSVLDVYGTNLTDERIQRTIDPCIGREDEIARLIQILSRRTKNNPLLLGDPGVGKTAIVEGLAKRIMSGDVPGVLIDKVIYTLDLGLIIAGSSFRGEFESRLKSVINEIRQNPNIILFIDEVHNIIGAGSATGSMDAANILKPSLARGEIRCIGATTMEEYKKFIENDLALERRFQPIMVHQPSIEKSIEILKGIRSHYEEYHQVKITDRAVEAACHLSARYIQDKFLPDKAIDLIDEAAAASRIKQSANGEIKKIKNIEQEINSLQVLKEKAVFSENFNLALEFRHKEEKLQNQKGKLVDMRLKQQPKTQSEIDYHDIIDVVSKIARVPLQDLLTQEKNTLLNLEKILSKRIVGQHHAISSVSEYIRRSKAGISDLKRPLGSFIFLGPSGVGKTELAKILAEYIFGGDEFLIRIDMSEFSESFNISKLIGSPAGYVGYKDSTRLTDMVRRKPYSVVLFDEIEKAHPQIFNILLQILEDGHLTDATGKTISFKNTIIIMTSNIGSEEFGRLSALGFHSSSINADSKHERDISETRQNILKKMEGHFKTEFLNRVDKIIIFNPLTRHDLGTIASMQLRDLAKRLEEKNIKLQYNQTATKYLGKISHSPTEGARLVRKNILHLIENRIAEKILKGHAHKMPRIITIKAHNNKITLETTSSKIGP